MLTQYLFMTQLQLHCLKAKQFIFTILLVILVQSCLPVSSNATTTGEQLRLITSFPPNFYTPFVEEFETLHPNISVLILNKKTTAAIDEILRGNIRQFDLFWSSSADAFDLLKSAQMLRLLTQLRCEPTITLPNLALDDPDGYYLGFAISGIGWMWNYNYLKRETLPAPQCWEDLEKPVYYGHLAMSTPSRSGTTHLIVENILQKYGWEKGWAYLLRISGNFSTITARSFGVPEGIKSQRFGLGLVIDFLAHTDQYEEIGFRYGKPAFPVPAGIAGLKNSLNHSAADKFIAFVLSERGQRILLRPEINRLPVHRDLLLTQKDKAMKLLQLIEDNALKAYDVKLSRQRYNLVNQMFDQLITFQLRKRRQIWKQLVDLEEDSAKTKLEITKTRVAVLELLGKIPVTGQESLDSELNRILNPSAAGKALHDERQKIIATWNNFINEQISQAESLLNNVE